MAKVENGEELLPKVWIFWVGRTNVTDDRRICDSKDPNARSGKTEQLFNYRGLVYGVLASGIRDLHRIFGVMSGNDQTTCVEHLFVWGEIDYADWLACAGKSVRVSL